MIDDAKHAAEGDHDAEDHLPVGTILIMVALLLLIIVVWVWTYAVMIGRS